MSSSFDPSIVPATAPSIDSTTIPPQVNPDEIRQNPTESDTQLTQPNPPTTITQPTLSSLQQTAITLLLSGHTLSAVAATLRLHRSTLYQWKRIPAFILELNHRQHEIRRAADARLRRLLQTTQTALDSLEHKCDLRHKNAFRLLTVLRPYIPFMDQPEPPFPDDSEIDALLPQPDGTPNESPAR
jgi:hypothetical protein